MNDRNNLIEVKNIKKAFGNQRILNGASLTINEGEILSILGNTGSGKTTLLKIIARILQPDYGSIIFNDLKNNQNSYIQDNLVMVWQTLALFPNMNVEKNIAFGLEMKRFPKRKKEDRVNYILDFLNLTDLRKKRIHQLSGGEKQKVALGRALAPFPKIILLDEPFSSIDYNTAVRLQYEIKKIHQELGTTLVLVTHNKYEAFFLSNNIAILNNGIIEQCGTPNEIIANPRNYFIANFINFYNIIPGVITLSDHSKIKIKTKLGFFESNKLIPNDISYKNGSKAFYLIPRNKVKISATPTPVNLRGRYKGSRFQGSFSSEIIELENNFRIYSDIIISNDRNLTKYDDEVYIDWDDRACSILIEKEEHYEK